MGYGRGGASTVQDEEVDLQHGTVMNRYLHSCVKGHYFKISNKDIAVKNSFIDIM
jgi:hypothetical protein